VAEKLGGGTHSGSGPVPGKATQGASSGDFFDSSFSHYKYGHPSRQLLFAD